MREPARPHLSGWCSPCCSPRAHNICQQRLDAQLLTRCECQGCSTGDEDAQNPHSVRDSGLTDGRIGAEHKAALGGASTPESQGLANADRSAD